MHSEVARELIMAKKETSKVCFAHERRGYERLHTVVAATLFVPATSTTLDCWVTDISGSGATLRCKTPLRKETPVILYLDAVGRFEAITKRWANCSIGVSFSCGDAKRKRLINKLNGLPIDNTQEVVRKRSRERVEAFSVGHFQRQSGEDVACEVLDISAHGLSLKTANRPAIGELLKLGDKFGCVVRHHQRGVGVIFVREAEDIARFNRGITPNTE